MKIENIRIDGLFGETSYDIRLRDNKLIIVAENGSGKTTIVNIIYYFLSRQWAKLLRYKFDSITCSIDGHLLTLNKSDLEPVFSKSIERQLKRFPNRLRQEFAEFIKPEDIAELYRNPSRIESYSRKIGISRSMLLDLIEEFNYKQASLFEGRSMQNEKVLSEQMNCQILYLPTFRRIEQELKAIIPDLEDDIDTYNRKRRFNARQKELGYVELVEFGMEDVNEKIKLKMGNLRENLNNNIKNNLTGGYLRDVINKAYSNISYDQIKALDERSLNSMLSRIDDSVLSKNEKNRLEDFVKEINAQGKIEKEETKIIAQFIYRLLEIYNDLKVRERDIEQFVEICNEYCVNKVFVYDNIDFRINIRPLHNGKIRKGEEIELSELSSGEKQIVSLFSHLFLSQQKDFFLIIDEPELSLSVPWQSRFLVDVVRNPYCKGLLAVTHSPFIFENELEGFTHGLNEFSV